MYHCIKCGVPEIGMGWLENPIMAYLDTRQIKQGVPGIPEFARFAGIDLIKNATGLSTVAPIDNFVSRVRLLPQDPSPERAASHHAFDHIIDSFWCGGGSKQRTTIHLAFLWVSTCFPAQCQSAPLLCTAIACRVGTPVQQARSYDTSAWGGLHRTAVCPARMSCSATEVNVTTWTGSDRRLLRYLVLLLLLGLSSVSGNVMADGPSGALPLDAPPLEDGAGSTDSSAYYYEEAGEGLVLSDAGDGVHATDVTSEALGLIGATAWHDAGFTGAGVKVGVLSSGFSGYAALLGTELPSSVEVHWATSVGGPGTSLLGTAAAEIVYDIAPGADLYLANFGSLSYLLDEWQSAIDWLIDQDVDVIIHPGFFAGAGSQPLDDTNVYCAKIAEARDAGVLVCMPSGDLALRHWGGTYTDANLDGIHEFGPGDPFNDLYTTGNQIRLTLVWDDPWGASSNDYDLAIRNSGLTRVFWTGNRQDGTQDPWEQIWYTPAGSGWFGAEVMEYDAEGPSHLDLFCYTHDLQYAVASGSLGSPGDSASALTVGAVPHDNPGSLSPTSSCGPTADGRTKPDLVGPTGVTTESGTWATTACAAAHVAGAAALVKEAFPWYGADEIQAFLETSAVDLGDTGKDNEFGSGRLYLPVLVDFGDAPDLSYPTLLASNGARHLIVSGFHLGASIDAETDGQPNTGATGDDFSGADDEDGVAFTSSMVAGEQATVDVTASAAGYLDAWMDFSGDGDWDDTGEQIFTSQPLSAGVNALSFAVPADMSVTDSTYARFRFSSTGGLSYTGEAEDGEVEDYCRPVTLVPMELALQEGWNMLSVPMTVGGNTVAEVFAGITPASVCTWNAGAGSYDELTPESVMDPKKGYWVAVTAEDAGLLTIGGIPVESWADTLSTGWHMIGSAYGASIPANTLQCTPPGSIDTTTVYWWNPEGYYEPAGTIEQGKGFWVAVTQGCDLTVMAPPP